MTIEAAPLTGAPSVMPVTLSPINPGTEKAKVVCSGGDIIDQRDVDAVEVTSE